MRIGCVEYMNAAPLVYGLERESREVETIYGVPSTLASMLSRGEIDVGLVPVVEHFRNADWQIVPGISISCRGRAESARLFCGVPVEEVESVGFDTASLTSRMLLQVVLEEKYNLAPRYFPLPEPLEEEPPDCATCLQQKGHSGEGVHVPSKTNSFARLRKRANVSLQASIDSGRLFRMFDCFLLIGDRCMRFAGAHRVSLDLGEEWFSMTGLPFVFAVWMARPGVSIEACRGLLERAKREGLGHIEEVAQMEAARMALPVERCVAYLREVMRYDLGEEEMRGMEEFRRRVKRMGYDA